MTVPQTAMDYLERDQGAAALPEDEAMGSPALDLNEGAVPTGVLPLVLVVFGGLAIVLLMLTTVVDVVGRSLAGATVLGAYELSELGVALVVAAGIPLVALRAEHIHIDLLLSCFGRSLRHFFRQLALLMTVLAEAVIAWQVWVQAQDANELQTMTSLLQIPVWPVLYVTAVLFGLAAIFTLINCGHEYRSYYLEPKKGKRS